MRILVPIRRLDYRRRYLRRHPGAPRDLPVVYVLHIGKTGGTFLKTIIKDPTSFAAEPVLFVPFGHNIRHEHLPEGARFLFATRDPVRRFTSGFYSRKRKGRPATFREWTKGEAAAFGRFDSANALAEALSAPEAGTRAAAADAMAAIKHVGQPHTHWFADRARLARDIAAGRAMRIRQEHLNGDLGAILGRLDCALRPGLIDGLGTLHANTYDAGAELSETALANLRRHYADDYAFLDWLDAQGLRGG